MRKNFTNYLFATFLLISFNQAKGQDALILKINTPSTLVASYNQGQGFTSTQSTSLLTADRWGLALGFGQEITGDVVVYRDTIVVDTTAQHGCNLKPKTGLNFKDKVVLIRRGDCTFSAKAFNAWKNGAKAVIIYNNIPNTALFNMAPTRPEADSVKNIPCVFTTRELGESIRNAVDGGQTVNVTFKVPSLFLPHGNLNLATPLKEAQDTRGYIGLAVANASTTDKLKPFMTATITEPDGRKVVVKGSVDTIRANTARYVLSDSIYKPSKIGVHKVLYTNSITTDSLLDSFRITDFVFAEDRGTVNGWVATDSASFVKAGLKFDVGHIYYTGFSSDKATHAGFAIHNPSDFPKNDEFIAILYPYTATIEAKDNDGTLTYDDLNNSEVALGIYKIKGTEKPDSMIFVEFSTPAALKDTSSYLLMIRYDGTTSGTGIIPQFSYAGRYDNRLLNTDIVVTYSDAAKGLNFYNGWSGGLKNIVRMYMQGFRTSLDNNIPAWAENTINVFPNPVSNNVLNIDFKLEKLNEEVTITINDVMGRVLKTVKLKNIQNGTQQINVSELGNGYYFAKIVGKDGWRTKVFSIAK
jgi:Secretion system C-terminal sorting domain/PA domain